MKALGIKKETKNKQAKLTLMLIVVILLLLGAVFTIQTKFNPFKKALGPPCLAPARCFFQPRPAVENVFKYTIELYEDGDLLQSYEMTQQEAEAQINDEGYVIIDFPQSHQDSTYLCKVKAENECGSATGQNEDRCEPCVTQEPTPTGMPTSSPTPIITSTLTPTLSPTATPIVPTTTPVPGCFDRRCDTNDDCIGLINHICKDIGGNYSRRCVLYPNANCNINDTEENIKICYCTTLPTSTPTPTTYQQLTNTPVPTGPTNTPIPGQPTVTPTGSINGGGNTPTPTDISIIAATNTPGPASTTILQQTQVTSAPRTTNIPSVGFINPTLFILLIGSITILIPLFIK